MRFNPCLIQKEQKEEQVSWETIRGKEGGEREGQLEMVQWYLYTKCYNETHHFFLQLKKQTNKRNPTKLTQK